MKKIISTQKAPAAIGPYSQAVVVDNMVYTSGVVPIDPENGNVVEGDIKVQATRVFCYMLGITSYYDTISVRVLVRLVNWVEIIWGSSGLYRARFPCE